MHKEKKRETENEMFPCFLPPVANLWLNVIKSSLQFTNIMPIRYLPIFPYFHGHENLFLKNFSKRI